MGTRYYTQVLLNSSIIPKEHKKEKYWKISYTINDLARLGDQIVDTTNDLAKIKSSNCWKKVSVSILQK